MEADKRAAEIQAREKRARENKRRKEEQEAKQREERRRLVQLGKLPEESLWGKVRASQPRLHNFFRAPQHAKLATANEEDSVQNDPVKRGAGASSQHDSDECFQDPGCLPSSAPAALKSQGVSSSPVKHTQLKARTCEKDALVDSSPPIEQSVLPVSPAAPAKRDAQLSFTGSQLFFALDDDLDLEVELNGRSKNSQDIPVALHTAGNHSPETQSAQSRKRKADTTSKTSPGEKVARHALYEVSANVPIQINSKSNTTALKPCISKPTIVAKYGLNLEVPSASQVQAIFGTVDFQEDHALSNDEENLDSLHPKSEPVRSPTKKLVAAHSTNEKLSSRQFLPKQSAVEHGIAREVNCSEQHRGKPVHFLDDDLVDDFADEFGEDLDEEIFQIASHSFESNRDVVQPPQETTYPKAIIPQLPTPQKNQAEHASPSKSNLQHTQNLPSTQTSSYDLDGLNDEDLAGLADTFNSSQHLKTGKASSLKAVSSIRPKSGRTIPWDTPMSAQRLVEEDDVDPGLLDVDGDGNEDLYEKCGHPIW